MDKKTIGSTRVFFVFHYYYYHYQKVFAGYSAVNIPGELSHQGHTGRVSVTITRISAF